MVVVSSIVDFLEEFSAMPPKAKAKAKNPGPKAPPQQPKAPGGKAPQPKANPKAPPPHAGAVPKAPGGAAAGPQPKAAGGQMPQGQVQYDVTM